MKKVQRITSNKLDIGCGKTKPEGFAGIDAQDYGQEIVWDLLHGIPIPDESIDTIRASHILEHFTPRALKYLIFEIIRVCRNGAIFILIVPRSDSPQGHYLGHLSFWNVNTIEGLCLGMQNGAGPKLKLEKISEDHKQIFATIRIEK